MSVDQLMLQVAQTLDRGRKLRQRAERRYERERFANWTSDVQSEAERVGVTPPTTADLAMLKRLAEMGEPFSAPQVIRKGWCGIRSANDATKALERFVGNGWLHRALPNREGQARYAFTRDYALGTTGPVTVWPDFDSRSMLIEAQFLKISDDGEAVAECGIESVPDPSDEADLWKMARKLAFGEGTKLHKISGSIVGLSPIQKAYAMAIAQSRIMGSDPIKTHIRGIAEYLGVDYNALRAGIAAAVAAIQTLNENTATSCSGQSRDSNAHN